jgi:hypothetical protein
VSEHDLTDFLSAWPMEPGRVNARTLIGRDGRPKVQVRIELGVIQMEMHGRPDGQRPEGYESLLALQRHRMNQYHAQAGASGAGFVFSDDELRDLRHEAMQFYHRYVALFSLGEHELVIRDTGHILEIDELCRLGRLQDDDRESPVPYRTPAITMRARAAAEFALGSGRPKDAIKALERGLDELRIAFQEAGDPAAFEKANEVQLLRGMREVLVPKLPSSQRAELHQRIQAAIAAENYELAAILRDELRMMSD